MQKVHWRKTAVVCEKCNRIRSKKYFIPELKYCASCEYDNILFEGYKKCVYCRGFIKKEYIKNTVCDECLKLFREKHAKFKKCDKLKKGERYVCLSCNLEKGNLSFPRGYDINNLKCKVCLTKNNLEIEEKFRCKHCGSAFLLSQMRHINKCERCTEKDLKWNREKMKKLRKDPYWKEYFRNYDKWRYWNVEKPLYNKLLTLQWQYGFAKKRKNNRSGLWYVLNHTLFQGFRRNFNKCYLFQNRIIQFMKTGKGKIVGDLVVLDNSESRKKFNEYLDSDEAMGLPRRPEYMPETIPIHEYFKE